MLMNYYWLNYMGRGHEYFSGYTLINSGYDMVVILSGDQVKTLTGVCVCTFRLDLNAPILVLMKTPWQNTQGRSNEDVLGYPKI
jgi:hypothetical protein